MIENREEERERAAKRADATVLLERAHPKRIGSGRSGLLVANEIMSVTREVGSSIHSEFAHSACICESETESGAARVSHPARREGPERKSNLEGEKGRKESMQTVETEKT